VQVVPAQPVLGQALRISCGLALANGAGADVLVDLNMDFPGRSGRRQKVFKLTSAHLQAGEVLPLQKTISLLPMSTRTYYPGRFIFTLLVNGSAWPLLELDIG
jgi:hypothetical protein